VIANNAASDILRKTHPASVLDMVLHLGDESYLGHSKVGVEDHYGLCS
jgi:hypothetical protein